MGRQSRASAATVHGIRLSFGRDVQRVSTSGESGYPDFTTATAAPVMRANSAADVWNT
jgi:hypothetical protein